jgi:hypothetical protein
MLANWTQATTNTAGTGAITLSSVTGFPALGDWFTDGDLVAYSIVSSSDQPIESGIGAFTASGSVLSRTLVQATFVGGSLTKAGGAVSAANLTGTNKVYISPLTGTFSPGRRATMQFGAAAQLIAAFPEGYANVSGGSVVANRIYLSEYKHDSPRQMKGFRVFCGSASGNINFAIYRVNVDGSVGKLLATTGSRPVAAGLQPYALTSPIWLPPDRYYVAAIVDNGSASFRLAFGYAVTAFGPDAAGNSLAFMTASPGAFTLPSPTWSGALSAVDGGNAGPAVFMELL